MKISALILEKELCLQAGKSCDLEITDSKLMVISIELMNG